MFYYLSQYILDATVGTDWQERLGPLRVLRYITFRSGGAAVTALLLSWALAPRVMAWLKQIKFGQEYSDKAEAAGVAHAAQKRGTPTMGGLLIILSLTLTTLLWAQWNTLVGVTVLATVVLCWLGFHDDYTKITQGNARGATSRVKLVVQVLLALGIGIYLWQLPVTSQLRFPETHTVYKTDLVTTLMLPFYKYPIHCGVGAGLLLIIAAIVGSSNAVNLTDGLDGLAIGCTVIVSFAFLVLTYLAGNVKTAGYLHIPYVPGAGELTVFCAALIGAGLGFLWYNCHPAQVFMGDTGSLAIGGALGVVAVLIHQPFVLLIAGGVFVLEALSVMLQTGWFKFTRKRTGTGQRIFLMAPLHHHFQKKNWHENQVVVRFYILCVLFAVMALCTVKLR
ncbi:MAG: Phospho-N-acetylmuramoyl-pentapeptide-transferase [Verrucomicrobiota bacterium]